MPPFGIPTFHDSDCSFDAIQQHDDVEAIIKQQQQQATTTQRQQKVVRFSLLPSETNQIRHREDISPREKSARWYTPTDLKRIRQHNQQIVKDVRRFGSSDQCMRGLEAQYDTKRKKLCRSTYRVVLQNMNNKNVTSDCYYEQLAFDYGAACKVFSKLAQKMGKRDERVAATLGR